MSDDYYDLLQVTPNSDQDDIEASYRRLIRMHDPETSSDLDAEVIREELTVAFETLSDPHRRAEYDRRRRLAEAPPHAMGPEAGSNDMVDRGDAIPPSRTANPGRDLFLILVLVVGTFAITLTVLNYVSGTPAPATGPAPAANLAQTGVVPLLPVGVGSPVAGTALPAVTPVSTPAPASLRMRFKPGDDRYYSYTTKITTQAPDNSVVQAETQIRIRYRVVEVHPDDSATITATYESASVSSGGNTTNLSAITGAGVRMRVAPDGTTSDVTSVGGPIPGDVAVDVDALSVMMIYPTEPLAIGGVFSNQVRLPQTKGESIVIDSEVRLDEVTTLAGPQPRRALVLKETSSMPWTTIVAEGNTRVDGRVGGEAAHYVDADTGWPIFGNATFTIDMSGSSAGGTGTVAVPMTVVAHYRQE